MNPIKEKFLEFRLRRNLRRHFDPDQKFLQSAKDRFLNQVSQRGPILNRTPLHHHVIRWRYALIIILIAISTTGGVMTYADANNVPTTHPLYPLKRWSEQIRMDLSTPQQQVTLHKDLAERRLHELEEVKLASTSQGPAIENNLANDFQHEADKTIDQAEKLNFHQEQRKALCQAITKVADDEVKGGRLDHFHAHCKSLLND